MNGAIIIEGHVQGLSNTRSLGEQGIPVWVVDKTKGIASYSKYCERFFECPDFQTDEFATFLIQLAQKEKIKNWLLLPSNDHAVYCISKHKEELSKYYKFVIPELSIIERIYDKAKLLILADSIQLPIPKTHYFLNVDEKLPEEFLYPVLTKGRTGLSFHKVVRRKAFLAKDENELRNQLEFIAKKLPLSATFTQELIPFNGENKTISFTAFCVNGEIKTHWSGVKLREHPVQFGTATLTQSVWIPELLTQSEKLIKALNYSGICEVEYLQDPRDGQYKLIEINARSWLWVGLAKKCGVDYAKIAYDFVNDKSIEYPKNYAIGEYWYNPLTDFIYSFIGIAKGKVKFKDFLNTRLKSNKENALFKKGDCKPGFMYFIKTFNFLKTR